MNRISLLLVSVFMVGRCLGQNYALQNSYITNPYLINPAAAASDHLNIFANYRNQWDGLAGAPKIATLGFSTLLDNTRVGIGFKASSFKRGFLNTSDASFTYAYGIPVNKQSKLFFGLSGGILSNSVDWSMISPTDLSDIAFANIKSSVAPSLSFGALLKNSAGFNVGIVLPQMLRSEGLDKNFSIAAQDNIMLLASYSNWKAQPKVNSHNKSKKTHKSGKNKGNPFEVFSIFRYSNVGTQVEATAKFNFQSSFWVSGTYRKISGLIPGLGVNLNNFSLGYFYESGIAGDIPLRSHELSLNIRVGIEKKFKGEGLPDAKPVTPTRPRFGEPDPTEPKISKQTPKTKTTTKNKETVAKNDKSLVPPKKDPVVIVPDNEVKKDPVVVVPDKEVKKDPVVVVPD